MLKSFMEQHSCQICHKEAKLYIIYKEFFAYLCGSGLCDYKWRVATGIFKTELEIKETKND